MFARPAPQLGVARGALHVDAVDDVEELLHDGHLLEHELDLPVNILEHEAHFRVLLCLMSPIGDKYLIVLKYLPSFQC